jgi:oxygen-dependent protoporphyrinogen oxidase
VLATGEVLPADDVVLGLPTHLAARLVEGAAKPLADALSSIPYTSAATVFFAYRRGDVPHPLDATGFVVPKREGLRVMAGTWVSSKWPGRAPEGKVLLRAFLGGAGREEGLARDDAELVSEARVDLERLMRFRAEPLFTRVYRFTQTSPLPSVGHAARVGTIRARLLELPGLHAIGSAYDGVGIPDTIRLAAATGKAVAASL